MKKELYFDRFGEVQFMALLEDGMLAEFDVAGNQVNEIVGNVYKGRVENVIGGMQAAFVNCGLERNCYLSASDMGEIAKYDGIPSAAEAKLNVTVGDEILVQVVKEPRGNKGAKVTTHLSFVGKNLIYLPGADFIGVSRKLVDEELRQNLIAEVREISGGSGGFVVRTSAPYATKKQLKVEADYLKKLYAITLRRAETARAGDVLFREFSMPIRAVRDTIGDELDGVWFSDRTMYEDFLSVAKLRSDFPQRKTKLYTGERSILRQFGIAEQVRKLFSPRVDLANGGYLVIQKTEALTVIDVNTGKYVGRDALEETVYTTNMIAAREIARQVRLRNIGGIVVVDFIDMSDEEHRNKLSEELRHWLSKDRTKSHVLPMSDFGLIEFTRKRTNNEVTDFFRHACPYCGGLGEINNRSVMMLRMRDDITDYYANGYRNVVVELNEDVMNDILKNRRFTEYLEGKWKGKSLYFIPHKTYHENDYAIRGDNSGVLSLPDRAQMAY